MATEMSISTSGDRIDYTPGSALAAGEVVSLGTMIGVPAAPIAANELGVLHVAGVAKGVTCLGTDVITVGAQLFWDAGNSRLTLTETDNVYAGAAASASANGVTTVDLLINAGTRTAVTS